tara:strand:- start:1581 stop:2669 length:1089 start_codon:yes stop_codon:yes gene_type:complete
MNPEQLANKNILTQPVYEPGKPIEEVARELGLNISDIAKLASNENPLGCSPKAKEAIKSSADNSHLYPDGSCYYLTEAVAEFRELNTNQIIFGNGSNEIIELIVNVFLSPGDEVIAGSHAFIVYKLVTLLFGGVPIDIDMPNFSHDLGAMANAITDKTKLIFLPSPNNPTGTMSSASDIIDFAEALPDHVIFCLDEAYAEYIENPVDLKPLIAKGKNIICLRTFSKIYGLAGLRVGYGYGSEEIIRLLNRARQPFNVNAIAQAAALAAIKDQGFVTQCRQANQTGLSQLYKGLESLNIPYVTSHANFVLFEAENAPQLFLDLQKDGIIARPMQGYGLPKHIRLSIGTEEQNIKALTALGKYQ